MVRIFTSSKWRLYILRLGLSPTRVGVPASFIIEPVLFLFTVLFFGFVVFCCCIVMLCYCVPPRLKRIRSISEISGHLFKKSPSAKLAHLQKSGKQGFYNRSGEPGDSACSHSELPRSKAFDWGTDLPPCFCVHVLGVNFWCPRICVHACLFVATWKKKSINICRNIFLSAFCLAAPDFVSQYSFGHLRNQSKWWSVYCPLYEKSPCSRVLLDHSKTRCICASRPVPTSPAPCFFVCMGLGVNFDDQGFVYMCVCLRHFSWLSNKIVPLICVTNVSEHFCHLYFFYLCMGLWPKVHLDWFKMKASSGLTFRQILV